MDPDVDYESAMRKLRDTARQFGVAGPSNTTDRKHRTPHPSSTSSSSSSVDARGSKKYNQPSSSNRSLTSSQISKLRLQVTGKPEPSLERDSTILQLKGQLTQKEVDIIELNARIMEFENATKQIEHKIEGFVQHHKQNQLKLKEAKQQYSKLEKQNLKKMNELRRENDELLRKYKEDGTRLDHVGHEIRQNRLREQQQQQTIQDQKQELLKLKKQLKETQKTAQQEANSYQKELNSLRGALQQSVSSVQEAKTLNLKFTEANKELLLLKSQQDFTMEERHHELQHLKASLSKKQQETKENYDMQLRELKLEYDVKVSQHQQQIETLHKNVKMLTDDQEQLIQRNAEVVQQSRQLQQTCQDASVSMEELEKKLEESEQANVSLVEKCETYMSQREQAQAQLETLVQQQADNKQTFAHYKQTMDAQQEELSQLRLKSQNVQIVLNDTQSDAHAKQLQYEETIMNLEGKLKILTLENMEQRDGLKRKEQVIDVMTLELDVARSDREAMESQYKQLEELFDVEQMELRNRSGEVVKQGEEVVKYKKILFTLQQHCQSQQTQLEEVTNLLSLKAKEHIQMMQTVTNVENDKDLIQTQLRGKIADLEGKLLIVASEVKQSRQALIESKLSNKKLSHMLSEAQDQVLRLTDEKEGAELALQSLRESQDTAVQHVRTEVASLQAQAVQHRQRIDQLTNERAELRLQLSRTQRQLELLESDLKSKSTAIRTTQAALEESKTMTHSDVTALKQELQQTSHTCAVLHGEKNDLETQLSVLQGKLDAAQRAQRSVVDVNDLKLQLQRKTYENEILFNQVATLRESRKEQKKTIPGSHDDLIGCSSCGDKQAIITAQDRELHVLYTQVVEMGEACGTHEEQIAELREEKHTLQQELAQKNSAIAELSTVNQRLFRAAKSATPSSQQESSDSDDAHGGEDEEHDHCMEHCPVRIECWKLSKDIAQQVNQLSALMDLSSASSSSSSSRDTKKSRSRKLPFLSPLVVRNLQPSNMDAKDAMYDTPQLILHEVNRNLARFNAEAAQFYSSGLQEQCHIQ